MQNVLIWIHILSAVGVFGGLLAIRVGMPEAARRDPDIVRGAYKLLSMLVLVALVTGFIRYATMISIAGESGGLAAATHMKVGIKMLLLVGIGGCLGMGSASVRKGKGAAADAMIGGALVFLAAATALGVWVSRG